MRWFRKSLSKGRVSPPKQQQQHKRIKKTSSSSFSCAEDDQTLPPAGMCKSLGALDETQIEVLDPEDFFHDPEHVRNYKEEAKFLHLMSDWVIVENPSHMPDNFFSADFEDELIQQRTQDSNASLQHITLVAPLPEQQNPEHESSLLLEQKKQNPRGCKRHLCELLFAQNIELGIALPKRAKRSSTKKRRKVKLDLRTDVLEVEADMESDSQPDYSSSSSLTGEPYATSMFQHNGTESKSNSLTLVSTCTNSVRKDCAINRRKLKTEALACSIMGAIGQCPARDATPNSSDMDSPAPSMVDRCHPSPQSGCDHYDIKQYFHLDDYGNILLNMNHIVEIKGYGLPMANNKSLYKRCRKQCERADEQMFKKRRIYCKLLKQFVLLLWTLVNGELRIVDGVKEETHYMELLLLYYEHWRVSHDEMLLAEKQQMQREEIFVNSWESVAIEA